MKKSIKAITAAISAAVLAALPMSTLTAGAFDGTHMDRTYVFSTQARPSYTEEIQCQIGRKGALHEFSYDLGTMGGSFGEPHGNGGQTFTVLNVPFIPGSNGLKRGIMMNFTNYTSNSSLPENLLNSMRMYRFTSTGTEDVANTASITVRCGDISGYLNQNASLVYDGLTAGDAARVAYLINAFGKKHTEAGYSGYSKCINLQDDYFGKYTWSYVNGTSKKKIDGTYYKLRKITMALLAADINGDGWVTPADSAAIMLLGANPDAYPNFLEFNQMPDEDINNL